ncbi:trypsin-like serine protease [Stigmatella sp. ncwal1]|uniref:Trypsin-like serine protease n=1 Tax=Stigmatella ashevillensis TaxID=2995309 RepID=A0ABT5DGU2_9BACT|nr:trypsin-like serine protease [Stigmatella ashevillena]MDC0712889.1 trypsin-like serine protease [Stigmatella ashevillena]
MQRLTWVLSLALGVSPIPGAIIGGTPAPTDPTVVALLNGGRLFCSGVLLSPQVVLTAAHCAALPRDLSVFLGTEPGVDGETVPVSRVEVHPAYMPSAPLQDIALLRLARPAAPVPWPKRGLLTASDVGRTVRIVGFGKRSREEEDPAAKHTGTAVLAGLDETRLSLAAGPAIPCFRDSGGAILLTTGGEERLVGLIQSGSTECAPEMRAYGMRADVFWEDFVSPFLEAEQPSGCAANPDPLASQGLSAGMALLALSVLVLLSRRSS